jgi:nucleoside 2-deoxyribosyltransferase
MGVPGGAEVKPFAVYVAASSSPAEAQRVRAAIAVLRSFGFVITSTWTKTIEDVGDANPRRAAHADRRQWAVKCLSEIDAADAVLFLLPEPPITTCGGWWEGGHAYSSHKHIVCSGDVKQSIFPALGHETQGDEAAIRLLLSIRDAEEQRLIDAGLRELADAEAIDLRLKHALTGDIDGGEAR